MNNVIFVQMHGEMIFIYPKRVFGHISMTSVLLFQFLKFCIDLVNLISEMLPAGFFP